ncbi:hypothetical protein Ancab_016867 [Ancistrocladus abbreviatus]
MGETGNVDYYALIGIRRACSRLELETGEEEGWGSGGKGEREEWRGGEAWGEGGARMGEREEGEKGWGNEREGSRKGGGEGRMGEGRSGGGTGKGEWDEGEELRKGGENGDGGWECRLMDTYILLKDEYDALLARLMPYAEILRILRETAAPAPDAESSVNNEDAESIGSNDPIDDD